MVKLVINNSLRFICFNGSSTHIRTGIIPSCGCINTTVWMHQLESNEKNGEKASQELHRMATCCFQQIPEVTSHKTVSLRPLNAEF